MMPYLVDANAVITPLKPPVIYTLQHALGYRSVDDVIAWLQDWYTRAFASQYLLGSEALIVEVTRKKDVPAQFIRRLRDQEVVTILEPTPDTFDHLQKIETYASHNFEPQHYAAFTNGYDGFYIALAKTYGVSIVTMEAFNLQEYDFGTRRFKGKVRMPFLAWIFGVSCVPWYHAMLGFS